MKYTILILALLFSLNPIFSQDTKSAQNDYSYSIFDCSDCKDKIFVSTNSGLLNTPFGLKAGLLCKTGFYVGIRYGQGKMFDVYPNEYDKTIKTDLYSITGGLIKPIFIKNNFSSYMFFGAGYGHWFPDIRKGWTEEGYELEGGLMFSYQRFIINMGANMLNGFKTYATWDFTVGLGYRF